MILLFFPFTTMLQVCVHSLEWILIRKQKLVFYKVTHILFLGLVFPPIIQIAKLKKKMDFRSYFLISPPYSTPW